MSIEQILGISIVLNGLFCLCVVFVLYIQVKRSNAILNGITSLFKLNEKTDENFIMLCDVISKKNKTEKENCDSIIKPGVHHLNAKHEESAYLSGAQE